MLVLHTPGPRSMQQCPAVSTYLSEMNDAEHELVCAPTFMKSLPMLPHGNPWHAEALSRTGGVQVGAVGAVEWLDAASTMAGCIGTAAASCDALSRDDSVAGGAQQLTPSQPPALGAALARLARTRIIFRFLRL